MELYLFILYVLVCFANASAQVESNTRSFRKIKNVPAVDALITRLEQERWEADDVQCLRTTLDVLWGVKNDTLWATWVWDSMQPPVGSFYGTKFHLGNYDQCLQAPWSISTNQDGYPDLRTQYCIVDVISEAVEKTWSLEPFDSADEYFRTPNKDTRSFNEQAFGVCLPASCSPSSVARISRHMHQLTHLPDGDIYVDKRDCRKSGEVVEYSRRFYGFWTLIGLLVATAVYSTFCNHDGTKQTSFDIITKSFCIKRNYNALFKVNSDDIKVMNGMRFMTAVPIVFLHVYFYTALSPIANGLEMDKIITSPIGMSLAHVEVVVDTFFAMSGLLLIRGLIIGKQKNVFFSLVKRYIRLIAPLAICILYITTAAEFMDEGPIWSRSNRDEVEVCVEHWWKAMLMINTNTETVCHVVSWYVSNDFQLAILGTFLFYLFMKNRKLGITTFVAISVGLTFNLGWMVYRYKLDILPFSLKFFFVLRKYTALDYTYLNSYSRAGPYLVGMVMGYILNAYKPVNYRNVISKKWSMITTVGSLATMLIVLSIGSIMAGRPYDALEAAVVVATNRAIWAIAVCFIIGACEYGSVPVVSDLLSWSVFVPLSKLSYGLYLLHPFIIQKQKYSVRSPMLYAHYTLNVNACGVVVLGCALSLVLHLIIEAPLINISNALFIDRTKSLQNNGLKQETKSNTDIIVQNSHAKSKIL